MLHLLTVKVLNMKCQIEPHGKTAENVITWTPITVE